MGFMNRRKAKEQEDAHALDPLSSQPSTSKRSKKGKKNAPEPKIELDLSTALPDNDSFRTSLMMTNLSARFSMLREQDDPNTKIGKANDDSVLFPKRASRLNLFNHNPLTDIAEVSSIRSSLIKPPFVREDSTLSLGSDGYASDEGGSIMNRSKPGEGNNLFGGRQKLYRIPVGSSSTKTLPDADSSEREASGMSGRIVYQNDVSLSMFQQIREKEREEQRQREQRQREQHHRSDSSTITDVDEVEAASSPSVTAFSKDRGTNSSTTSGPLGRRTSTAATSVASEPRGSFAENRSAASLATSNPIVEEATPWDHIATVQRKLYGQAVDQSSPTHRAVRNILEGATRPRAPTYERKPHALSPSKSASNLSGKYSRAGPFYPPVNFRTASPPPSSTPPGLVPMDLGLRDNGPNGAPAAQTYGSLPPLSPPASDGEDALTYTNSVQPEDRGKATAMGLFNKPQKQYDELQFSQRQVQMHEGRISPLPQRRDDNSSPSPRTESPEKGRYSPTNASEPLQTENRYSPVNTSVSRPGYRESPQFPSSAGPSPPPGAATFRAPSHPPTMAPGPVAHPRARADTLRHPNAEPAAMEAEHTVNRTTEPSPQKSVVPVSPHVQSGTFLDNFSPSDDEAEAPFEPVQASSRRPPSGVHPALRDGTIDFAFEPSVPSTSKSSETGTWGSDETERAVWNGGMNHATSEPSSPSDDEDDSGLAASTPGGGLGLSGLIRSHLRHDSDKSSIYPPASISLSRASVHESPRLGVSARSQNQPESIHSNPWEFDDLHARTTHYDAPDATQDLTFMMSQKAKQILGQATAFQNQATTKARQFLRDDAPLDAAGAPVGRSWQEEMMLRHQRDDSTETKHERQEFDNELAERRRRVKENFQSLIDTNNRPASPLRHPDRNANGPTNPLSALKHKTSKSSLKPRQPEHQTKAMKMLGIANGSMTEAWPDMLPEDQWKEEEERMLREHARRKPRSPGTPLTGPRPRYNDPPRAASPRTTPFEDSQRVQPRSITPTAARNPRRDRAGTTTSVQSRSYGDGPREDTDRPMIAGTGNYGGLYDKSNKAPSIISLPRPSLEGPDQELHERSSSATFKGRQRSNSRHTAPGPFDNASSTQGYHEPISVSELPPPLPIQAYSANSTPPLSSPALSSVSTPTLASYPMSHDGGLPPSFGNRSASALSSRKKSVTKKMISDPTLVSSTSNIPAISLPAPPHFKPHELASPPLPVMNPRRRRQTTTQNLFSGTGINDKADSRLHPTPEAPHHPHHKFEDRSTFSDEGEHRQPRQRARLRKTSSEGGSMNLKARQQAMMASSPAMPRFPPGVGYSKPPPAHALNGGMF